MNNYPENLKIDNPRNLKLGIKSSFSKIKSPLALIYFLWKSNGRPFEILFSKEVKENNDTIKIEISDAIKKKLYSYLESKNFSGFSEEKLNKNLLFKAQIESLVVVFELIYKLASFSFQNTSYTFSKERTGKSRYNKIIRYTSNIDLFENFIKEDINFYEKILFEWLLEENTKNPKEKRIIDFLTIISDDSIFKTIDFDGNEIKFSMAEIYKGLVKNKLINFKNNKENTGSLRILPNLLKEKLNSYIDIKDNNLVKKSDVEPEALDNYANRVSEGFKLKNLDLKDLYNSESFRTTPIIKHSKIDKPHQKIFFGAPGTGKSYEVSKLIKKTYPDLDERENPFVFRTTIYKDYSYYDFVGTIMPVNDGKKITYQFKPGIFTEALFRAIKCPNNHIFLVIEEMSRGNISGIFGDIFQLLDRDKEGNSEYSITNDLISKYFSEKGMTGFDKIILPSNLHIIGTVNTSDQNVNVIDTAFKRRFDFVYSDVSPIKNNETGEYLNSYIFELEDEKFEWNKFYMTINDFIVEELSLSEDKQIGQFFIKFDNYTTAEDKFNAIKNKLLHYLWEDVKEASFRETNIFKENKSFLKLYKDFEKKKNIFSGNFMKKYEELVLTDE
jgi:putative restriction enzyme